ncbi:MAG: GNAT family N-acetyltransferase [Planctomycetota bacterium]
MIRRGSVADLEQILAVENACFATDRMDAAEYRRYLARGASEVWVIARRRRIAATLVLARRARAHSLRVYSIAVHPDHRGHGLARRLMQQAIARARTLGMDRLTLEVRPDNAAAMALYASLGMRRVRELAGYYEDGASALKLALSLRRGGRGTGRATSARR